MWIWGNIRGITLLSVVDLNYLQVDEEGAFVIDHLNYDASDEGQHTKLAVSAENLIDAPVIVGPRKGIAPLLYQGTGILTDPENPLVLPLLTADSTAYSYNPEQAIKEVSWFCELCS